MTTEAFRTWANNPHRRAVVCAELTATRISDDEELVIYVATAGGAHDDAHNWTPCIKSMPSITQRAQRLLAGQSLIAHGSLTIGLDDRAIILGPDGEALTWDEVLTDYRLTGGGLVQRLGGPRLAWSDWAALPVTSLGRPKITDSEVTMAAVSQAQAVVTTEIPPNDYDDSVPDATAGRPIPLCLGNCQNITPKLIDDSGPWVYQFHDPSVSAVQAIDAVYVDGAVVSPSSSSLTQCTISFNSQPSGRVTCDVRGWKPGGAYVDTAPELIEAMLVGLGGVASAKIDAAGFAAAAAALPYEVGLYLDNRKSIQQTADALCTGLPLVWHDTADGLYTAWELVAPSAGEAVIEMHDGTAGAPPHASARCWNVRVDVDERWYSAVAIKGNYNNTVISSPASGVSADRQEWLAEKYRTRRVTGGAPADNPEATEAEHQSCLVDLDDCETVAGKLLALFGQERRLVSMDSLYAPLALTLGQQALVVRRKWGMSAGWPGVLVEMAINQPGDGRLTFWG